LLPPLFSGVELSPVVPLGTCSAVGLVDQHRVVSTVRGSEVASDPTNALAVEAALRRRASARSGRVHVAACQRVVRAQRFGPGASAHFRLFALVSTGRDTGSGRTEAEFLVEHLAFLARAARTVAPRVPITLAFTPFRSCAVRERFHDVVLPAVRDRDPEIVLVEDTTRTQGSTYYDGAALRSQPAGATATSTSATAA
jgi:hypothetical protein